MNLQLTKHQPCPLDEQDGVLLVDVETETVPATDEDGNPLYYCLAGEHTFSVDAQEATRPTRERG